MDYLYCLEQLAELAAFIETHVFSLLAFVLRGAQDHWTGNMYLMMEQFHCM